MAPLVLDLCNQQNITVGLQGKFSVCHGAAVGLVRGRAGHEEYSDAAVNDPAIMRVRERTTAVADVSITDDQALVEVELADGRVLSHRIEQSLGNVHRPLSDAQLDDKFRDQARLVLTADAADAALALCWQVGQLNNVQDLVRATVPAAQAALMA